jgi:hypothetical protein
MKQRKSLILTVGAVLFSGLAEAAVVGDSIQGYMYTSSTLSYVVTQFNTPVVVDNTGLPEFTGNFHYEFNTTAGPYIKEFDVMLDIGDNYLDFWFQPTNDWGNTASFSSSGTIFTVQIADIDATGLIENVGFDAYYYSTDFDEFGPIEQWDPTWGSFSWTGNTITFGFHGATNSGERFRYYFTEGTALVPVPATVWLFGSGLIGLIGVARRKYRT